MNERVYTVIFISVVAAVCALGLAGMDGMTRDLIEINQKLASQKGIMAAMKIEFDEEAPGEEIVALYESKVEAVTAKDSERVLYYRAYTDDTKTELDCYALIVTGGGFQGTINGIMSLEADLKTIRAMEFLSHSETPGLGARIEEAAFKAQFEGRSIYGTDGGVAEVLITKSKDKDFSQASLDEKAPNEIDSISGASETSRNLSKMLKKNLADFFERLESNS